MNLFSIKISFKKRQLIKRTWPAPLYKLGFQMKFYNCFYIDTPLEQPCINIILSTLSRPANHPQTWELPCWEAISQVLAINLFFFLSAYKANPLITSKRSNSWEACFFFYRSKLSLLIYRMSVATPCIFVSSSEKAFWFRFSAH